MGAEDEVLLMEKRRRLVSFILGLSELAKYPVPDRLYGPWGLCRDTFRCVTRASLLTGFLP